MDYNVSLYNKNDIHQAYVKLKTNEHQKLIS